MALFAGAGAALAVLAIAPRPADACSCATAQRTAPAEDARDVPTNAVLLISGYSTDGLELAFAGGSLPVTAIAVGDFTRTAHKLHAAVELEPDRMYWLRGIDGQIVSFSTAAGPDMEPPPPAEILDYRVHITDDHQGSCGPEMVDAALEIAPDADVAYYDIEFSGGEHEVTHSLLPEDLGQLGAPCRPRISAGHHLPACVSVTPRDLAGNAGPSTERCTIPEVSGCASTGGRSSVASALLVALALVAVRLWRKRSRDVRDRAMSGPGG